MQYDLKKIAIITTHPIQYNAPWFKLLSERKRVIVKVFYTWGQIAETLKFDPGFGKIIDWDIPLLDGYEHQFMKNVAVVPGSHHYAGIDNPTIIEELKNWNPDAILVFGWCFKSHLKILRYFKGKTITIFRGDSNLIDQKNTISLKKNLRKIFLKWVYSHVDKALYVGTANKDYYIKYGLQTNQIQFAPHAIDNDRFQLPNKINYRQSLSIPENAIIFIYTGKFELKKDPLLLLEVFISLDAPETHLVMVGNGILEEELRWIAMQQLPSIRERIHFMPFQNQSNMPAIYKMADIVILPSQGPNETWGLAVNEAMACGKAVLVSDKCGCAQDLVVNGVNGYIFKSKSKADLLIKMKSFLLNLKEIKQMGIHSLEIIQDWRYEKICIALENIVLNI